MLADSCRYFSYYCSWPYSGHSCCTNSGHSFVLQLLYQQTADRRSADSTGHAALDKSCTRAGTFSSAMALGTRAHLGLSK